MSNAEETLESKRSSYVDEFLESGRKKTRNTLSTQNNLHIEDLEYMLKSVQAKVTIINETWNNCEGRLSSSEENNSSLTFEREVFEEVKVEKNGRNLTISTRKVSDTKDFGNLPSLSEDLSKLVYVDPPEESDILLDYNKYVEKSSILCKELLLPFLTGLKEHLENVQAFLGQIEEWLIEPGVVVSFLSKLFDKQLDDVEVGDVEKLYCSCCLDVDSKVESTHNLCTENGRNGLKAALAFVKTFKPVTQIEVKDAGVEAVNGTYTIYGVHDGVYGYTRSCLLDGKPTKFYLIRDRGNKSKYDPNKKRWFLTCDDENPEDDWAAFYFMEATGEENELPPLNVWGKKKIGVLPRPQIVYKIDD